VHDIDSSPRSQMTMGLSALCASIIRLGWAAPSQAELRTENGFLRDQVRRLTDELARAQSALGHSHSTADGASQGGRSFLEVSERQRKECAAARERAIVR
jgi:hypothetical protein